MASQFALQQLQLAPVRLCSAERPVQHRRPSRRCRRGAWRRRRGWRRSTRRRRARRGARMPRRRRGAEPWMGPARMPCYRARTQGWMGPGPRSSGRRGGGCGPQQGGGPGARRGQKRRMSAGSAPQDAVQPCSHPGTRSMALARPDLSSNARSCRVCVHGVLYVLLVGGSARWHARMHELGSMSRGGQKVTRRACRPMRAPYDPVNCRVRHCNTAIASPLGLTYTQPCGPSSLISLIRAIKQGKGRGSGGAGQRCTSKKIPDRAVVLLTCGSHGSSSRSWLRLLRRRPTPLAPFDAASRARSNGGRHVDVRPRFRGSRRLPTRFQGCFLGNGVDLEVGLRCGRGSSLGTHYLRRRRQ